MTEHLNDDRTKPTIRRNKEKHMSMPVLPNVYKMDATKHPQSQSDQLFAQSDDDICEEVIHSLFKINSKTPIIHPVVGPSTIPSLHQSLTSPPTTAAYVEESIDHESQDSLMSHVNYVSNLTNLTNSTTNQIPFISEEFSTHSNSISSYPSILALKLSFTNQASNDAISILSPARTQHRTNKIINGEVTPNVTSSDNSSFYDAYYTSNVHKNIVVSSPKHKRNSHSNKPIKNANKSNMKTLKLTPEYKNPNQSRSRISSLLDHADTYDPPQPSLHNSPSVSRAHLHPNNANNVDPKGKVRRNNAYKIQPMLQSVVEEISDQSSLSREIIQREDNAGKISLNNNGSADFQKYKRRQEQRFKIINANKLKIKHNSNANVNVNININNMRRISPKSKSKSKSKTRRKVTPIAYKREKSSSCIIDANKKQNLEIRRPQTQRMSRVGSANVHTKKRSAGNIADTNRNIMNLRQSRNRFNRTKHMSHMGDEMRFFTYDLGSGRVSLSMGSSDDSMSDTSFTSTITSSDTISRTEDILTPYGNSTTLHRRPVRIIRRNRKKNGMNNMVRATSAAITIGKNKYSKPQRKYGLYEDEMSLLNKCKRKSIRSRYRHEAKENEFLADFESMDHGKLFLESRTEMTMPNYDDLLSKLSVHQNNDHKMCKKEVHDAYERGFLAGYFLGVNIMQQQQKDYILQTIGK